MSDLGRDEDTMRRDWEWGVYSRCDEEEAEDAPCPRCFMPVDNPYEDEISASYEYGPRAGGGYR